MFHNLPPYIRVKNIDNLMILLRLVQNLLSEGE